MWYEKRACMEILGDSAIARELDNITKKERAICVTNMINLKKKKKENSTVHMQWTFKSANDDKENSDGTSSVMLCTILVEKAKEDVLKLE